MRRLLLVLMLLGLSASNTQAGPLDKLTFYTERFPPYQYVEDGNLAGIHIEITRAVFRAAETDLRIQDVKLVPWARGYNITKTEPNTVLFGTGRKPSREDHFIWVGPLAPGSNVILARSSVAAEAPDTLDGFADRSIATVREDASEHRLIARGVPKVNLRRRPTPEEVIVDLLKPGRLDYWAYNGTVAQHLLAKHGLGDAFEPVLTVHESHNYYAVNPRSDPDAVAALRRALDRVKERGRFADILAAYR